MTLHRLSPAELDRTTHEHALELLRALKKSKSAESDIRIARNWVKLQWSAGWKAAIESKPRKKPRTDAAAALKAPQPVTPADIVREHLESRDACTKSWAPLIAPAMFHMQQRCEIPLEEVLDYIYSHEPVDVFEFNEWARARTEASARRAIA